MTAPQVEALMRRAHALVAEERAELSAGRFGEIGRIAEDKQALLAELEPALAASVATPALRADLEHLIAESRRNERLIEAARAGLATARRRIDAIMAVRGGAVAYARDGSTIASRAASERRSNRA